MLIQSSFIELAEGSLLIPRWLRAPLALSSGTRVFLVPVGFSPRLNASELVLSVYPPELWGDLWRLEADLREEPGALVRILEILDSFRIRVVTSETFSTGRRQHHSITMILDCSRYASARDLSSEERSNLPNPQLVGVYSQLAAELISLLVFTDRSTPRLRLRRIHSYHAIYEELAGSIASSDGVIADGRIALGREMLGRALTTFQQHPSFSPTSGPPRAMLVADSKDRLLRAVLTLPDLGLVHARLFFRGGETILSTIVREIHHANFDIVRAQVRGGLYRAPRDLSTAHPAEWTTVDVVLESLSSEPGSDATLLRVLDRALGASPTLATHGLRVSECEVIDRRPGAEEGDDESEEG
jgi:hypothetical protein